MALTALNTMIRRHPTPLSLLLAVFLTAACTPAGPPATAPDAAPRLPNALEFEYLGEARVAHGYPVGDTTVGGLSALTYDPATDRFHVLSDGPGTGGPARFYTVRLGLADGELSEGDVTFDGVTEIRAEDDRPFSKDVLDPEGLAHWPREPGVSDDLFFLASEGNAPAGVPPFVGVVHGDGRLLHRFPLPPHFHPGEGVGIRRNLAFEPLALSPSGRTLWTGTESALFQDGPEATPDAGATVRLLRYALGDHPEARSATADREVLYPLDAVVRRPLIPGAFRVNGLVEVLVLDDHSAHGRLLALERSFTVGRGNSVRLYDVTWSADREIADKTFVLDLADLGIHIDNLEGMTWGPTLPDGRRTLVMVSDDNFSALQVTQFLAFGIDSL